MRQARSDDRLQKIDLLRSFENGDIGVDSESIKALGVLAGMGTVWRDHTSRSTDYADVRAGAMTVLGNSGMDEARKIVFEAIDLETHPMALVAGFEAIANLGAGDSGLLALRVLNDAMLRNMARTSNNSVADEYLKAMEKVASSSDPDLQTIEVLTMLSQGRGFSQDIRSRANTMLKGYW